MARPVRHHVRTLDEYFEVEARSLDKLEWVAGEILLMAGGSARHNLISLNAGSALLVATRGGPCRALSADQRLATADGLYTYADATLVCGPPVLGREQTLLNPTLLVEVLSDATREYDRGEKLARYRTIPSLRHVLLIEHDRVEVEHWRLSDEGWSSAVHTALEAVIRLDPPGIELALRDLYAGVEGWA